MRYETAYRPDGIQVREQEARSYDFMVAVAKDLKRNVSVKRRREIDEATPTAAAILANLQVQPAFLNAAYVDAWERGALVLGMSAAWNTEPGRLPVTRGDIAKWFGLVYGPAERQTSIHETDTARPIDTRRRVMEEVFKRTWGTTDFAWVKKHKSDGLLVTIPYTYNAHKGWRQYADLLSEIHREEGILGEEVVGIAFPGDRLAVVTADADGRTEKHEELHLINANLDIEMVGESFNEGTTELIAAETYKDVEGDFDDVYEDEVGLVCDLTDHDNKMADLVEDRYSTRTKQTAIGLAAGVINRYGLPFHAMLYAASPEAVFEGNLKTRAVTGDKKKTNPGRELGLLTTKEVRMVLSQL